MSTVPARPMYVGVGECRCGRLDARVYRLPGTTFMSPAVCSECLVAKGFEVPKPRTAEDVVVVDGKTSWKPTDGES